MALYGKNPLIEPRRAKRYAHSVGHDGVSNAIARSGEPEHAVHHVPALARGMEAQQHTTATLGKPPKPKGYPISVHNAMRHVTSGNTFQSISRTEAAKPPEASGPNPLEPDYRRLGAKQQNVPIYPGMRSRQLPMSQDQHFALGKAILDEAYRASGSDTQWTWAPTLPDVTTEDS